MGLQLPTPPQQMPLLPKSELIGTFVTGCFFLLNDFLLQSKSMKGSEKQNEK